MLAHVLRLRILVAANMWGDVANALHRVETVLGLSYDAVTTPKPRPPNGQAQGQESSIVNPSDTKRSEENFIFFEDSFEAAMAVHTLMMSVVYYTHIGSGVEAGPRLSHLHALLDSGALDKFPEGIVEVSLMKDM